MLIIGVLAALLAGYWAYQLASAGANQRVVEEVPRRDVVVAAHDIAGRTVLTAADLQIREVPDDASLVSAPSAIEPLVGRVTSVPLAAGQVVYASALATTPEGAPFSVAGAEEIFAGDAPYWRAVSVLVPRERAVAGQIVAGQRVDLFATVTIEVRVVDAEGNYVEVPTTEGFATGDSTKILFQDVEVLQSNPDDGMYVLKVSLPQAEQINHIAKVAPGAFSLALRPDGDTRYVDTSQYGETNDSIIMRYVFPVPQIIDLSQLTGAPIAPLPPRATPAAGPTPVPDDTAGNPTEPPAP